MCVCVAVVCNTIFELFIVLGTFEFGAGVEGNLVRRVNGGKMANSVRSECLLVGGFECKENIYII